MNNHLTKSGELRKGLETVVMLERTCLRCGETKPVREYNINRSRFDGHETECRTCQRRRERKRMQARRYAQPEMVARHRGDYNRRRLERVARASDGSVTRGFIASLLAAAAACPYCGDVMRDEDKTIDHIVPVSRGGANSHDNIIVCCRGCNSAKRDRDLDAWFDIMPGNRAEAGMAVAAARGVLFI